MAYTPIGGHPHLGYDSLGSLRYDSLTTRPSMPSMGGGPHSTGSGGQLSSRLDQQLSCAICLERYDEPRILKCSHSFCRRCLVQLLEQRADDPENPQPHNHLTCPKCRDVTVLSELGVDALPINWDLMQVVDIIGEDEDDQLLDINSFPSHPPSSQLSSFHPHPASSYPDSMPRCHEHNRLLDFFCDQCDMLVCATCAINTHGGHKPKEAQQLMTELRSQCIDPLEIRFLRTNVAIDENTRVSNQIRKLGESHKHRIRTLFQELRNTLNSRELALVQSLDGIISKKCSTLHTQCLQLQQLRDKLNTEKENVSQLLQIQNLDYTVLLKRKQISSEVDSVVAEVDAVDREPVEKIEDGPECVLRDEALQEASEFGEIYCTPTPAKFVASGTGLEKGMVGREAEFVVEAHDKYGQRAFKGGNKVEVTIVDPKGVQVPVTIDNARRGRTLVKYTPIKVGFHAVTILVDSQKISNYQWNVMVYNCRDYSSMSKPRLHLSRQQISDMSTVKSVCVLPGSGYLAFSDQLCIRTVNLEGLRLVKRAIGLAGSPSGLFSMPIGIAANGRDELFVADRQARKILKLASDGRVIATYGGQSSKNMGLSHPEAVAVGTDKLFVVDTGNKTVQMLSLRTGKFKVIGGRGVQSGLQLREPQGVAVDEVRGHLYITDTGYNCLLCVSLTTFEPIATFGQGGEVPLISPTSVAVDQDGFLLVTSSMAHLLFIVSPQGAKVKQLGGEGTLFKSPSSVCVDQLGNVIVADPAIPCVHIF